MLTLSFLLPSSLLQLRQNLWTVPSDGYRMLRVCRELAIGRNNRPLVGQCVRPPVTLTDHWFNGQSHARLQ